jgi:uncharacterized protein (DUF1330 family)
MSKNETPCIAILQGTFKSDGQLTPEFQEYSQRSNANGQANGGKLLGKYLINANLGQGPMPHVVFVVEFPSRSVAESVFTNEEYRSIIPLRDVAFEEVKILLSDSFEQG